MTKPVLLIVDDEPEMREFVSFAGEVRGYEVVCMSSGKEIQEAYLLMSPSLILMDVAIPDIDAIGLLEWLGAAGNRVPILLMSGHGDYMLNWAKTVGTDLGMSIIDTLSKPIALEDLEKILNEVREKLAK